MFVKIPVVKNTYVTKIFKPIQDSLFRGCSRMGGEGSFLPPPPKNLRHISYNDETWHSYTLPEEDQKNV